ncbi:hypothetical protein MRX96_043484 [Rhipicephalus microplus]
MTSRIELLLSPAAGRVDGRHQRSVRSLARGSPLLQPSSHTSRRAVFPSEDRQRKLVTVIGQIELQEDVDGDALQRSDSRSAASTAVLYYLGGYVVKKAAKMTSCSDCHCTLESASDAAPAAVLTELRSFVPGALKHPSAALTCMLSGVECVIERHTKSNQVFGDLFWRILEELSENTLSRVGCPLHFQELSARIIKFYLATRMHFYSRFLEQQRSSSAQIKAARKRAKLLQASTLGAHFFPRNYIVHSLCE